jgi:hypothetical protein
MYVIIFIKSLCNDDWDVARIEIIGLQEQFLIFCLDDNNLMRI